MLPYQFNTYPKYTWEISVYGYYRVCVIGFLEDEIYAAFTYYGGNRCELLTLNKEELGDGKAYNNVSIIRNKDNGTIAITGVYDSGLIISKGGFPETFLIIGW